MWRFKQRILYIYWEGLELEEHKEGLAVWRPKVMDPLCHHLVGMIGNAHFYVHVYHKASLVIQYINQNTRHGTPFVRLDIHLASQPSLLKPYTVRD